MKIIHDNRKFTLLRFFLTTAMLVLAFFVFTNFPKPEQTAAAIGTLSGTVYDTDGVTPLATSPDLKMVVGANMYTTTANGSGVYSFTSVELGNGGDITTIWLDGGADRASYVLVRGTFCTGYPNCTGVDLVKDQVILDSRNTSYIVNTDLASCDNDTGGDCSTTDIGFTANGGVLTLTWATNELRVASLTQFRPGGNVTAQKLDLYGTYKAGTEVLTLSGAGTSTSCTASTQMPICVNGGTFTAVNGTVNFTSTSATSVPNAVTYYNLGVGTSADASAVTYTLAGNATVNGTLTVGNAASSVADTLAAGSTTLTLTGNSGGSLSVTSQGIFDAGSSTVVYNGNISKVGPATYNNLNLGDTPALAVESYEPGAFGEVTAGGAIDAANGFVYYPMQPTYGNVRISKIRMSDNTLVDYLELPDTDYFLQNNPIIDATNGFLYLTDNNATIAVIIKISTRTFTRVGTLTLNSGEDELTAGLVDEANGFAYYATNQSPSKIIKINLTTFTRDSAITLSTGENNVRGAAIDLTNDFAYFVTNTFPARIVKVNLATFLRDSALTLNSGENAGLSIAIDIPNNNGYIQGSGVWLTKINTSAMTRTSTINLSTGEILGRMVMDQPNQFLYLGSNNSRIVKVNLTTFLRDSATNFPVGYNCCSGPLYDSTTQKLYIGDRNFPAGIMKFDIATMSFDLSSKLQHPLLAPDVGAIDYTRGYIYYPSWYVSSPAALIKYRIRDAEIDGSIDMASDNGDGEFFRAAVMDEANGFLYVVNDDGPVRIIKFDIVNNIRVGHIILNSGEDSASSAAIDTTTGKLYVATETNPSKIVKIDLATFLREDVLTLSAGGIWGTGLSIDETNGFAYVGTYTSPGEVYKINLGTFTEDSSMSFDAGEEWIYSGEIDAAGGFGYYGTDTAPAMLLKVNLNTMTRVGALTLNSGENYLERDAIAIDPVNNLGYLGFRVTPGIITQVDLATMTRIGAVTGLQDCSSWWLCQEYLKNLIYDTTSGYLYAADGLGGGSYSDVIKIRTGSRPVLGTANSQTITVSGNTTVIGDTLGNQYNPTVDLNGNLTINAGKKLVSTSGTLSLAGNLTNNGTFTHNSGTVTIDGGGTTNITGNAITFNNFTSTTAGKTIQFDDGVSYVFDGTFNLQGSSGNNIVLQSDNAATQWLAYFGSAQTSSYLSVRDSGCSPGSANVTISDGTDNLNNDACFVFASSNNDPDAPTSLGPTAYVDGSTGSDNTPTLTFTLSDPDVADTVQYRIQIDDTSDFSSLAVDYTSALAAQGAASFTVGQAVGGGSYTVGSAGQTLPNGAYYWRVLATDNSAASSAYTTANGGAVAFVIDTSGGGGGGGGGPPPLPPAPPEDPEPDTEPPAEPPVPETPPITPGPESETPAPSPTPPSTTPSGGGSVPDTIGLPFCPVSPPVTPAPLPAPTPPVPPVVVDDPVVDPVVDDGGAEDDDQTPGEFDYSVNNGRTIKEINDIFKQAIKRARAIRKATIDASDKKSKEHKEVVKSANDVFKLSRSMARKARRDAKKALKENVSPPAVPQATPTPAPLPPVLPPVTPPSETTSDPVITGGQTETTTIISTDENGEPCLLVVPADTVTVEDTPESTTPEVSPEDESITSDEVEPSSFLENVVSNTAAVYYSYTPPGSQDAIAETPRILNSPIAITITELAISIPLFVSLLLLSNFLATGVSVSNLLRYRFSLVPQLLRFKRTPRPWGSVYDSTTKRPLPYSRVEILNDQSRQLESVISDPQGRYGFLVAEKFATDEQQQISLNAEQKGYVFPSRETPTSNELELYPNVYKGGMVNAKQDTTNFDLPMDSVNPESKLVASPYLGITSVRLNSMWTFVANLLFVVGTFAGVVNYILNPSLFNFIPVILILLTFVLRISGFKLKSFGTTVDRNTNKPIPFSFVAVYDEYGERVNFTVSDELGRYFLLVPKGKYTLKAFTPSYVTPNRTVEIPISARHGWISKAVAL